ncbi:hypothetical protein NIES2107_18740 [Nostoc carneum NIES-2107]|nr:hypothetical protein NIES2107_18740 [Nostoc carneum NIES-2107]
MDVLYVTSKYFCHIPMDLQFLIQNLKLVAGYLLSSTGIVIINSVPSPTVDL